MAALEHTAKQSYESMAKAVEALEQARSVYSKEDLDKKESYDTHKALSAAVMATVDPLNIHKDSLTHTFLYQPQERAGHAISTPLPAMPRPSRPTIRTSASTTS